MEGALPVNFGMVIYCSPTLSAAVLLGLIGQDPSGSIWAADKYIFNTLLYVMCVLDSKLYSGRVL